MVTCKLKALGGRLSHQLLGAGAYCGGQTSEVRSVAQAAWQAPARLPAQLNAPHTHQSARFTACSASRRPAGSLRQVVLLNAAPAGSLAGDLKLNAPPATQIIYNRQQRRDVDRIVAKSTYFT